MRNILSFIMILCGSVDGEEAPVTPNQVREDGVRVLLKRQQKDGGWGNPSYELQERTAITALAGMALLAADPNGTLNSAPIVQGVEFILKTLGRRVHAPPRGEGDVHDYRAFGHAYALQLFETLLHKKPVQGLPVEEMRRAMKGMGRQLVEWEKPGGGWNYCSTNQHAAFMTAPVLQGLLAAKRNGLAVPREVVARGLRALRGSKVATGSYMYYGPAAPGDTPQSWYSLAGSSGRAAVSEATLWLFGESSQEELKATVEAFFTHWEILCEKKDRSAQHEGPHGISFYFFSFGQYGAAQAIAQLEDGALRARSRERLWKLLGRIRNPDGTWSELGATDENRHNYSIDYSTALILLALAEDDPTLARKR